MIFEKTIDTSHKQFRVIEWQSPQTFTDKEYSELELQTTLEHTESDYIKNYKKERYEEYKTLGFPVWKRAKLKDFTPGKYSVISNVKTNRDYPLDKIDEEGIELLKNFDFEGSHRKFVLMGEVFSNTGFYVRTREGMEEENFIIKYEIDSPIYENTVLNIKKNSKINIVRVITSKNKEMFKNSTIRGIIEEGAELNIINVNLLEDSTINIDNMFFDVGEDAKVKVYDFHAGGRISAPYMLFRLASDKANGEVYPYFLGTNANIIDMVYVVKFYNRDTVGVIDGKGVLKDSAKAVFRGSLDIKQGAKEANGNEMEYTLVLSDKAKVDAIPCLVVDENEVNASHAATVGSMSEEKLYYMMTRGFSKEEAKKLISYGIFEKFIDQVEVIDRDTAEVIRNVIKERL